MSSPRDRDGFDDRSDGSGWQEPPHLGGGEPGAGRPGEPPAPSDRPDADPAWQPPGWDLPPAEPERPRGAAGHEEWAEDRRAPAAPPEEQPVRGGLFGPRRPRTPGELERIFAYQGDEVGAQGWAVQHGWTVSDGSEPADAVLAELVTSAPTRLTRDHRPAGVMRGRFGTLELVAFDVVYVDKRSIVPEYAITAAPVLTTVAGMRLSPARFWRHRTGGLVPIPSGDPEFDGRWVLLATEDSPQLHRLAQDPAVRGLLLGSDDGDEFWSASGHVAAIRPDGHRPELIEHHARLLTAIVGALAVGA